MTKRLLSLGWTVVLFAFTTNLAIAETKLPSILGSHMVLQQGEPCPIWGWDQAGITVAVTFAGQSHTAKADANGRWQVNLTAMKANAKGATLTVRGSSTLKLEDVLVGEVWLCSGQSNMEWPVRASANPQEEIANAKHPLIRHIKVPHQLSPTPRDDMRTGGWQVCSPQTAANFTAVGYYFARHLQEEIKVPIGLIGSNWGGTRIEPWTPPVGFKNVPALKANFANRLETFTKLRPGSRTPTHMYNAMIHPILPFNIKGALWYQGESNNGEGMLYFHKMQALIGGWRNVWKKPNLPFYFVQLAPFTYGGDPKRLPGIWQAQLTAVRSIPNTGMAVTTDISNLRDIHPKNKQDVGKRLALWALAKNYGKKDITYSGPLYKSLEIIKGRAVLHFDHAEGLKSRDGKPLTHFEVLSKDGKWLVAGAYTHENKIVIAGAKAVPEPQGVRFGWDQRAEPNLVNGAGLPASPFLALPPKKL